MHFESDTQLHSKSFPEIPPRNGYDAAQYKAERPVGRCIGSNARILQESDG
jgi:hypothetical protein